MNNSLELSKTTVAPGSLVAVPEKTRVINYGNFWANIWLWQKALFLVPVWAIAVVPVFGLICRCLGNGPTQIGYGLVLCLLVFYFLGDLLKRKISMDDDYIYFGFRAVPIKSISSLEVSYKKNKFLPATLRISCSNSNDIKFQLDSLTDQDVEQLLKHLQSRNSNLQTTPVLSTLVKCRHAKPAPITIGDKLEIAYKSRVIIDESVDEFRSTALKWIRHGPLVASVLFAPVWLGALSSLYVCLQPNYYVELAHLNLNTFLMHFAGSVATSTGAFAMSAHNEMIDMAKYQYVAWSAFAALSTLFLVFLRSLWKPNFLLADKYGIKLVIRIGELSIPIRQVLWDNIRKVNLFNNTKGNRLRITKADNKNVDIDLSAISPENRKYLLKKIEKMVPDCQIDHDLSQSMLPKADHNYTELWLQSLSQPPERNAFDPLQPGQLVGENRYEVIRSLGVGGQGTAYLCKEIDTSSTVVLKETILPIFADSSVRLNALEKFQNEANLLKSLKYDGVAQLFDFFIEDHRCYLVLEHIDGITLHEYATMNGAISENELIGYAVQMCNIISYLHTHGVIHRDFTPDNLILGPGKKIKLIDFNVAQQIKDTATGTVVGKYAYLPPEQFRGKATQQSDIYAFGATLFYLLTGTDPEPISQSSPSSVNPKVSSQMNEIVKRATALTLDKRFQSAEEIVVALEKILSDVELEMAASGRPSDG